MTKKWVVICTICIIVGLIFSNIPQKPELISSIVTNNTVYLTILVDEKETKNLKKLEEKILRMYQENSFDNIKLQRDGESLSKKTYISVYAGKKNLEEGNVYFTFIYDEGE